MTLERHPGEWTHDPQAGATYLYLNPAATERAVARTVPSTGPIVNFDVDEDGRVIGIEIIAHWPSPQAESAAPNDHGGADLPEGHDG